MRTFPLVLASGALTLAVGCGATAGPTPGSQERAAATVADHRASCPPGTALKQSRHDTGKLKVLVCLDPQGRQNGRAMMYDKDGRPELAVAYVDGKMHGPTTLWHTNGKVFLRGEYQDGLEHGRWQAFKTDGTSLGAYTMAQGTGERTRWHKNGTKQQRVQLVRGVPDGKATEWHPNGTVAMQVTFKAGRPDGTLQRFHMNGDKAEVATYLEGELDGEQRMWTAAGSLESLKRWRAGKLHGKSLLYTRTGVFKTAACFVDDKLVWDVDAIRWVGDGAKSSGVNPKAVALERKAKARPCPPAAP